MRLTASHVREFVEVSRTDFQRWLTILPPYSEHQTEARKARAFEARDLVFFAMVKYLTSQVGLKLDAIANFSECMRNDLTKLSDLSTESRQVALLFSSDKGWSIDSGITQAFEVSLKVDVSHIWFRVHQFLGLTSDWAQNNLPLGLQPVVAPIQWQKSA